MTDLRKFPCRPTSRACRSAVLCAASLSLFAGAATAQTPAECSGLPDEKARLACYDQLYPPAPRSPVAEPELTVPLPPPPGELAVGRASAVVQNTWELAPSAKRGTFSLRTYRPNYALVADYTSDINENPSSPTRTAQPVTGRDLKAVEAKFQVSLRAKVVEGLVFPNADLWFGYTQRSLWQVWNPSQSSPFRSTDYEPEAIYVLPVGERAARWPGGVRWEMVQLGVSHQSNGQSEPFSRSWNRVWASTTFTRGDFALSTTFHRRLHEDLADDDNPDLTRFIGNTELRGTWFPGVAATTLTWRTHNKTLDKGSLQLDWSYPIDRTKPQGLRWFVQVFSGYGETLLDYNHRQNRVGFGLTLFRL
ncbi:phospholipase A [Ramlibacter rhizophilus]|uniref:Phospholipase A1 n=1 Tax=Ramlibacter rhizophilus TaxID=1781167 RepID=A0A4Z0BIH1_9BURK|nr:phospholipase A [Ramlibacter rhizophilus]TFY98570.1 phospholipase [Ramlibacter rhizophilus]